MLQSVGSQRVGHDWATEQQHDWTNVFQTVVHTALRSLLFLSMKNKASKRDTKKKVHPTIRRLCSSNKAVLVGKEGTVSTPKLDIRATETPYPLQLGRNTGDQFWDSILLFLGRKTYPSPEGPQPRGEQPSVLHPGGRSAGPRPVPVPALHTNK